jgi:hypothetical protein
MEVLAYGCGVVQVCSGTGKRAGVQSTGTGVQEYRSTGVQEYRSTGVQEYRSTGVQEYRSTGVQEYRSTGVPVVGLCVSPTMDS